MATTEEKQQKLKPPEGEREEKAAIALCRALYSAAAARAFAPAADLLFRCRGTWLFISERCSFRGCSLRERSTFSPLGPLLIKSWMPQILRSYRKKRVAVAAKLAAGDNCGIYRSDTSSGVGAVAASCLSDCSSCGADSRRAVGVASARDYAAEENYRCEGGGCSYSYRCEDAVALAPLPIKSHLLPVPCGREAAERPSVSCP